MPFYDDQGNEVQGVLSAEEVEQRIVEEKERLSSEFSARAEESTIKISELEERLTDAQSAADVFRAKGGDEKDQNFKVLRDAIKNLETQLNTERTTRQTERDSSAIKYRDKLINQVGGNDAELKKKILFHFNETLKSVNASDEDGLAEKMRNAIRLAGGNDKIDPLQVARGGTSFGMRFDDASQADFTRVEVEIGSKMGISDADRKRYGNDPRLKARMSSTIE